MTSRNSSHRFLVLGAGLMGRAVVWDLIKSNPSNQVTVVDSDQDALHLLKKRIQNSGVRIQKLDVTNWKVVKKIMDHVDVTINATSYKYNVPLSRLAIQAGCHFCDMGGNETVVSRQTKLAGQARKKKITIVPACGLAPGMVNVIAIHLVKMFDTIDHIQIRVGGLPQKPRPPLDYQLVFSAEGLLNEYLEPATVIHFGKVKKVNSLQGEELISFPEPYDFMEAFYTSGGLGRLPGMLKGKVYMMDYKTIRFWGHAEKMRMLLGLGFSSGEPVNVGKLKMTKRKFIEEFFAKNMNYGDPDIVLARVKVIGTIHGKTKQKMWECIDRYDKKNKLSAMMRTTSFPTSIIAQMLAEGKIRQPGVWSPEQCVPADLFVRELGKRKIRWFEDRSLVWPGRPVQYVN